MIISFQFFHYKYFKYIAFFGLIFILLAGGSVPAYGGPIGDFLRPELSVKEEKELGEKVLANIKSQAEFIYDPSVLNYVESVGRRILAQMGPQPFEYNFYVIRDSSLNAFAIPGGHIFLNSGLIEVVEKESELAGVISHEMGHVVSRHIAKRIEKSGKLNLLTLAGVLAGAFLGVLGGDSDASGALSTGSMALAQTLSLKYSRQDEWQADTVGFKNIVSAGYNPRGLIDSLKKILKQSWLEPRNFPTYLLTHPAAESRIGHLEDMIARLPGKDLFEEDRTTLHQIQVKLVLEDRDPQAALNYFQTALKNNPRDANFYYGLALANQKLRKFKESVEAFEEAIRLFPQDHEIIRDLGICYFFNGKYNQAVETLMRAIDLERDDFLARYYLGRIYQEMNSLNDALIAYHAAKELNPDFEEIYYHLGVIYGKMNLLSYAHHNLGIYFKLKGKKEIALFHFETALKSPGLGDREKKEILREIKEIFDPPHLPFNPPGTREQNRSPRGYDGHGG
jgi:predicted Zn-dependent protease